MNFEASNMRVTPPRARAPSPSNLKTYQPRYISLDLEGGLPVNDIRNRRLKLFPKVLEGPWVVRKAVGKPCVIGKKLTARYFRRYDMI